MLLFSLIVPITGTYIWLKYEKKLIKREMKQKMICEIDESELAILKFAKSEVGYKLHFENANEFEFESQMYDVVEFELSEDSIIYKCWCDNDESRLNKKLANLVSDFLNANQKKQENDKKLINYLKTLYCEEFSDLLMWPQTQINTKNKPPFCYYSSLGVLPNIPPPKSI